MKFPRHKCGLYLEHNQHRDYYQSAADYLAEKDTMECPPEFRPGERQKCIDTDEIWILHWYPDTPIGSYQVAASTLEALLEHANENEGGE
jgi:hypothetical protein